MDGFEIVDRRFAHYLLGNASLEMLATGFRWLEGRRLNAPNDVVVKSDGSVWFSDPLYGIQSDYEGGIQASEQPPALYRLDPVSGDLRVMASDFEGPNGLAFSPDESRLYVSE